MAQFVAPAETKVVKPQPPVTPIIGYSLLCEVIRFWSQLTEIEDCKAILALTQFLAET